MRRSTLSPLARWRQRSTKCGQVGHAKWIFTERVANNRWLRYYCKKERLTLTVLSRRQKMLLERLIRPRSRSVCFARFAAYDIKGRQVATGNEINCPWQQHDVNVKTWWPNVGASYSTDNRSNKQWGFVMSRTIKIGKSLPKQWLFSLDQNITKHEFNSCNLLNIQPPKNEIHLFAFSPMA